jgi:outer membrane usher protein FimD/PapC
MWMKYTDPNWTPPERWDNGITGLIFDYNLSGQATRYQQDGGSYQSFQVTGRQDFNLGAWRVRSQYQANYTSDTQGTRFDWDQFYAYRPCLCWRRS